MLDKIMVIIATIAVIVFFVVGIIAQLEYMPPFPDVWYMR